MILDTQQFFIDVLTLIPFEDSVICIHSPHDEVLNVIREITNKSEVKNEHLELTRRSREILIYEIIYNDFGDYIHSLEVKINEEKVFEGYDGMEYGMFSKGFELPQEFKEKYTKLDMCMISKDW